ncbi:toll-like receptor 5 [Gastrophryne carolinensis]
MMAVTYVMVHHVAVIFSALVLALSHGKRCKQVAINVFLTDCNFTQIPYLANYTRYADLSYNYIQELNSTSFPLLKELLLLKLNGQQTQKLTLRRNSFINVPNLIELDLSYIPVLVLDQETFSGLSTLQNLLLIQNNLNGSILENDYFKDLFYLELLDLSDNRITYLKPHPLFYYLHNFHMLVLRHNKISRICAGDLHSFQQKTFSLVDLSHNKFYLDENSWGQCGNPFQNINFVRLALSSNGMSVKNVKSMCNALNGTKIQLLQLSSHQMGPGFGFQNNKDPDNTTFAGLVNSNLQNLNISYGYIFTLKSYVFGNLTSLINLDLSKNKINLIEQNAFQGLHHLDVLDLSKNLLGELYDYSFEGLPSITSINLNDNHIGIIQGGAFKNLKHLQFISLEGNALNSIVFVNDMPIIQFMNFKENKLKKIESSKVDSNIIDLSENQLEDLGILYKLLQNINLNGVSLKLNRLSVCWPFFLIPKKNSLHVLNLSNNMVQLIWENGRCLDIFHNLSALQYLDLSNNHLNFLPDGIFRGLISLQQLNLTSNVLRHLQPGVLPSNLEILDVSKNQLISPNPEVFYHLKNLHIGFNPFFCGCPLVDFLIWLNETNITSEGSQNELLCSYPDSFFGQSLYNLNYENCDEEEVVRRLSLSLFVFTLFIVITLMTSVITYNFFRGVFFSLYKRLIVSLLEEKVQEPKMYKYDAYLCYNQKDFQWVENVFLKNLDSEYCERNPFSVCFEERNFIPGEDHIVNIRDAIWNSKKTICIVTNQFLKDGWCVEAFNYAQSRYFTDLKDVLIMVVVGSISEYQLKKYKPIRAYIQRCQYLKWPENYQDVDWFLSRLSYKIMKEEKPVNKEVTVTTVAATIELQQVTPDT